MNRKGGEIGVVVSISQRIFWGSEPDELEDKSSVAIINIIESNRVDNEVLMKI